MKIKYVDSERMTKLIYGMFQNILNVIGHTSATKYMIPNYARHSGTTRSGRDTGNRLIHPTKTTWRTGRLARSMSMGVGKNTDVIKKVRKTDKAVWGTIGTKVPYARFHEHGKRPFLNVAINDIDTLHGIRAIIVTAIKRAFK